MSELFTLEQLRFALRSGVIAGLQDARDRLCGDYVDIPPMEMVDKVLTMLRADPDFQALG